MNPRYGILNMSGGLRAALSLFHRFDVEAHGPEAVVAGDHGGMGIFHPAIKKVSSTI